MNLRTVARWLHRLVSHESQEEALLAASALHLAQHAIPYLPGDAGALATQVLTPALLERSKEQEDRAQRLFAAFHGRLSPFQTYVESEALWTVVLSLKATLHFQRDETEQLHRSAHAATAALVSLLTALHGESEFACASAGAPLAVTLPTTGECAAQAALAGDRALVVMPATS